MAASHPGDDRQPLLADEIKELEQAEKATAALQAHVEKHGSTRSPIGAEPQEPQGVTRTPRPPRVPAWSAGYQQAVSRFS